MSWTLKDLEEWNERIYVWVQKFGLSCFEQEFEICDHDQMLGYMAYSGMPSHYPHWSYGKAYEKLKTLYDYGITGLPYEVVINSNPCLAYLMKRNSLLLQILTMAHVYGHNDFFKNNFTFTATRPELTIEIFKVHADRVRSYCEDPTIGSDKVETILDAAHALSLQCRRNLAIRKLSRREQEHRLLDKMTKPPDEFQKKGLYERKPFNEEEYLKAKHQVPLEPEEDILLFIRDNNRFLNEWKRDLLTIVHETAQYFIPQIETTIMNEGWATFWHYRILKAMKDAGELSQGLWMEFMVRHNQVVAPLAGRINPYYLGYTIWQAIDVLDRGSRDPSLLDDTQFEPQLYEELVDDYKMRNVEPPVASSQNPRIFLVREADRDTSFLRQYLTFPLMKRMNLLSYAVVENKEEFSYVVENVSDETGWRKVKEELIRNVGMGTVPVIKVVDANFERQGRLLLKHYHDGRDLELEYAEKTLKYVQQLWQGEVILETVIDGKETYCFFDSEKFVLKSK